MKRPFKKILILSPFAILFLIVLILFITKDKPPVAEIKDAQQSISQAKTVHADKYSKKLFKNATTSYDIAIKFWKEENERFFLFRDFNLVKEQSIKAAKLAKAATAEALANSKNLDREVKRDMDALKQKIDYFENNFDQIPQVDTFRKQYNKGKLLFGEAKLAFEKSDLNLAKLKIDQSKKIINSTYYQAETILKNYFKNYPEWQRWSKNTINFSKDNNTYSIVIDKFSRKCFLYYDGMLKETFDIDLGSNWMGEKNQQGDKSTPEGNYKIIEKKENGKSRYHKAMLINYPNEDDLRRFAENKKKGLVSSYRRLGSLIEIHGDGGKGADWTEGCIALSNGDIDRLYAKCSAGTHVTIVGSLRPLNEIIK
jgi:lipoprotein-anchoring transpeptidase ErfK/SrfK